MKPYRLQLSYSRNHHTSSPLPTSIHLLAPIQTPPLSLSLTNLIRFKLQLDKPQTVYKHALVMASTQAKSLPLPSLPSPSHSIMNVLKGRFLMACLRKWRKVSTDMLNSANYKYSQWALLGCSQEEDAIPRDVPKGHMVLYVGEQCKRFVIRVAFLQHPLFRALLQHAQEVYEFNPDSKLCIPCDESIFVAILRHVSSQHDRRNLLCF